jgi:peptidoglycan hydrolase-like protein with peptidoglycan-binding domain
MDIMGLRRRRTSFRRRATSRKSSFYGTILYRPVRLRHRLRQAFHRLETARFRLPTALFDISLGSQGDDVKSLRRRLKLLGYRDANGNRLDEDSVFGQHTLEAVNRYKDAVLPGGNLAGDRGVVGSTTWGTLRAASDAKAREDAAKLTVGVQGGDGGSGGKKPEVATNGNNSFEYNWAGNYVMEKSILHGLRLYRQAEALPLCHRVYIFR